MASYTAPDLMTIQETTGIDPDALGLTGPLMGRLVKQIRPRAEADVASEVSAAKFTDTTLTPYQAINLQEAICYQTAARLLRRVATGQAGGTFPPLMQEGSERIMALIEGFETAATRLANLVARGEGQAVNNYRSAFGPGTDAEAARVVARDIEW